VPLEAKGAVESESALGGQCGTPTVLNAKRHFLSAMEKKLRPHAAIKPSVQFFKMDFPQAMNEAQQGPEQARETGAGRVPGSARQLEFSAGNSNSYASREEVERRLFEQAQETNVRKMQAALEGAGSMQPVAVAGQAPVARLAREGGIMANLREKAKKPF